MLVRSVLRAAPGTPTRVQPTKPSDGENIDWEALLPAGVYARFGRRALDLALLATCLPLAMLPGLVIAAINLVETRSLRRIFFVQERVGYRGRVFRIFQFRTMRDSPQSALESWATGADSARVTRFGRFLRSSHLDELPQLLNVAKGDMGFIGPRPEMVPIESWANTLYPEFSTRLAIRPGITGLAQITQGYTSQDAEAYRRKLETCLAYNQDLSLRRDTHILWRTALWMLRGRGWLWREGVASVESSDAPPRAAERDVEVPQAALPSPVSGLLCDSVSGGDPQDRLLQR